MTNLQRLQTESLSRLEKTSTEAKLTIARHFLGAQEKIETSTKKMKSQSMKNDSKWDATDSKKFSRKLAAMNIKTTKLKILISSP
jgi:hypothetical protein